MPSPESSARARAQRILEIVGLDEASMFLEHVSRPGDEVRPTDVGWLIDVQFIFRSSTGARVLDSPNRRGAPEPRLLIQEWPDPHTGEPLLYNYDVTVGEFGEHFGFHLHVHESGREPYPHRQGYGVPGIKRHEEWRVVELDRGGVLWDLVRVAFEIDNAYGTDLPRERRQ